VNACIPSALNLGILELRMLLEERECRGHNWKVKRTWKPRTVSRVLAVLAAILERCASEDWKMLPKAPNVPLLAVAKSERKWVKREQAIELLKRFPLHTRDMTIMALATGLRRSNITHLQWERIDLARCCWVALRNLVEIHFPHRVRALQSAHFRADCEQAFKFDQLMGCSGAER
jgi:integrase